MSAPPGLIVHSRAPLNAEPPLHALRAGWETPVEHFYIRSHAAETPALEPAGFRLHVGGAVATPLELSLPELKARFTPVTVTAVMQCAGNRRSDLHAVRPVTGSPWAPGAIGNARWTGARLRDVLRAAGADEGPGLHVALDAADVVEMAGEGRFDYGISIPMEKARAPEVLLAWAMNGQDLTPDHGYPLRAVVPGYAGARSPKWLRRITVQHEPSGNPMQQHDYKLLPPDMEAATIDWSRGITINAMPLNAAICQPAPGARLPPGRVEVRGYAIASDRSIARVEVSCDDGRTWTEAVLEPTDGTVWTWTFWHAALDLPSGRHELVVRAWDSAAQTQPARPEQVWNCKGYLSTAWHRVTVEVG